MPISAGGETRSSNSQRADDLPVAALAADGAVLAVGDLTFLVEPDNAAYDNDPFIANIADFLGGRGAHLRTGRLSLFLWRAGGPGLCRRPPAR